jgi:hypothetical protein
MPSLILDGINDRHGVLAVTVELLIAAAFDLEYNDAFMHVGSPYMSWCFQLSSQYVQGRRTVSTPHPLLNLMDATERAY